MLIKKNVYCDTVTSDDMNLEKNITDYNRTSWSSLTSLSSKKISQEIERNFYYYYWMKISVLRESNKNGKQNNATTIFDKPNSIRKTCAPNKAYLFCCTYKSLTAYVQSTFMFYFRKKCPHHSTWHSR